MPKWVLVVEDDEVGRELLGMFLRAVGHAAVLVRDGQEAWELLDQGRSFDLIMSDHDMPRMTGVELLRQVRTNSHTVGTKFMLMSGDVVVSKDDPTPLEEVCTIFDATFVAKPLVGYNALIERLLGTEMPDDS